MATFVSLLCQEDETATQRVERAKLEGQLPVDAYKGPIKRDRYGESPTPTGNVHVLGDVIENNPKVHKKLQVVYFICVRREG